MKSRFPLYLLLIALPVLAFCALGIYFLVDKAPKLINAEKAAITREYRDLAESLSSKSVAATFQGVREKGWRQISKIDRKFPWGVVDREDGKVLVWIEKDNSVLGVEREAIDDHTAIWIYCGFGFAMLFVILVANVGIVLLLRYNRERESFLAGMVHDFTNPLSAIRGLVKSDPDYVIGIADSMMRMVRNAQDFLGLGRRRNLDITRFDLIPIIRDSYRLFEEYFTEDESGAVQFEMPEKLEVSSDLIEVRQILWNLFSNAAKYAAPYGPVNVSVAQSGNTITVEFADQGIGMTPRQMRRAFDCYYRAAGLHECGKGGFGIGLSTSRAAARRLGGDLTVRQNHPKGCVFILVLPIL